MPNDKELFKNLLGDDIEFFNKDSNQSDLFRLRKQVLDHEEKCECNNCQEISLLEKLGLG